MIIQKFGGTSVGSVNSLRFVANIIQNDESAKIVVLSAMSGTTNKLYETINLLKLNKRFEAFSVLSCLKQDYINVVNELFANCEYKIQTLKFIKKQINEIEDIAVYEISNLAEKKIVSKGEIITSYLFSKYLTSIEIENNLINATEFLFLNSDGEPDLDKTERNLYKIMASKKAAKIYITEGFICTDNKKNITNLGRGGSDYSASIIGAALNSEEVQIWSDKDGLLNNDPRVVNDTFPLKYISYKEAEELAYFGAKILHPQSIYPAKLKNIRIVLKNTFNPSAKGTLVTTQTQKSTIRAVAAKDNIIVLRIKSAKMMNAYGFLRKIFEIFDEFKTPVDVITTSEVSVSVTIEDSSNIGGLIDKLSFIGDVQVEDNMSIICLVGNMSYNKAGIACNIFNALNKIPIKMISQGASNQNITLVVDSDHKHKALNELNNLIFNEEKCLEVN